MQLEAVAALHAAKVAVVGLREDEHGLAGLGDGEGKSGVEVAGVEGDVNGGPLLGDGPFGTEEADAVEFRVVF